MSPPVKKSKYFSGNQKKSASKSPSKKKSQQGNPLDKTRTKGNVSPQSTVTQPPRKRSKIAPGSAAPPDNWERTHALVAELRADRSAPIDAYGAHAVPEAHVAPRVRRFQILTALMLSSQTKDAAVAETMRKLQRHGLTAEHICATDEDTLNDLIHKVGFHNSKTKYLKRTAQILLSWHNGDVPLTAKEMMTTLPGVGPKMAYIAEYLAHGTATGVGVDTHMHRIFNALKWVDAKNPEQTREQLEGWLPKQHWGAITVLWVGFGQEVQQQKEKMLRKSLGCSAPREALSLVQTLNLDVKKESKRFGLEEVVRRVMDGL